MQIANITGLKRADFHYQLPPELIAQHPPACRSAGRLLMLTGARRIDSRIADLPQWLEPGDLVVFNDTRVIPARLLGRKESGGRIELLIERLLPDQRVLAQVHVSKPLKAGARLDFAGAPARFVGRRHDFFEFAFEVTEPLPELLERIGQVPLPPYIQREPEASDHDRYQTLFARVPGAVAAPTAGLHFDHGLIQRLTGRGVEHAFVTLHVGAGTFQPMRVEDPGAHRMHAERYAIPADTVRAVAAARDRGGRLVAVGTTVARALESAATADGSLTARAGETELFIYPGYHFRVLDALLTNFHLPQSTLLMLVCAFGGTERTLAAYRHAVAERYRFFSYGDAMLIDPEE